MTAKLFTISTALLLLLAAGPTAHAVECAHGANRAGCAGANGAVAVGPNGAAAAKKNGVYSIDQVHTTNGYNTYHTPAPGTSVTCAYGNTATKAVVPGCAWVNRRRVCN
jgi:hypothetical protein